MKSLPHLLVLVVSLSGCPSGDPCADDMAGWIEVGDGFDGFEPIEDGVVLAIEYGSQGGQHVWASIRGNGMHPGSRDVSEVSAPPPCAGTEADEPARAGTPCAPLSSRALEAWRCIVSSACRVRKKTVIE